MKDTYPKITNIAIELIFPENWTQDQHDRFYKNVTKFYNETRRNWPSVIIDEVRRMKKY